MIDHILTRAKAYAALVGSVLTAAAALYVDSKPLALAAAVCTAIATYAVPNAEVDE